MHLLTLLLVVTLLPVQAHAAGATLTGTAAPQAGDTVTLTIYRDGKTFDVDVKLVDTNDIS